MMPSHHGRWNFEDDQNMIAIQSSFKMRIYLLHQKVALSTLHENNLSGHRRQGL